MKFHLNDSITFIKKNINTVLLSAYYLFIIMLFFSFFYSISNTTNNYSYSNLDETYINEETANVGTFITDSNEDINTKLLSYLNDYFSTRNESFLTGSVESLYKFYDLSHSYSRYSLNHEFKRISYLRDWGIERGITFESITSTPYIKSTEIINNIIKLKVDETFNVSYFYTDNPTVKNSFAITLLHTEELQKIGNGFSIQKDYFFDSFENGLKKYNFNLTEKQLPTRSYKTYEINFNRDNLDFKENKKYNRLSATTYADKYSGVLNNNSNSTCYNDYYFDASSLSYGGNSTNFVSQCLGDNKTGGYLKQDNTWFYNSKDRNSHKVSEAWLNPKDLKDYLTYSAKGSLIKNGDFKTLVTIKPNESSTFSKLQIGDLIFYTKGEYPIYSAIITAFDSNGYPLVNSNTVNRFHVPFDLGWTDDDITFQLINIIQ
ncbi:MAG: amidase domain-containing protein [Clostridium sp.]